MASICQCLSTVISPPPAPCDSNCIYAPSILVSDSVTACDVLAEIDITPIIAKCGDSPVSYSIISYKNVTGVPTIDSEKVTFVPFNNNYASAEIVYKVSCGILSAVGKIIIVYKNNCVGTSCAEFMTCNKCTGICEDNDYDYSSEFPEDSPSPNTSGLII
jgi:hypothetical protein